VGGVEGNERVQRIVQEVSVVESRIVSPVMQQEHLGPTESSKKVAGLEVELLLQERAEV
jgi:hypothetical protein